MEIAHLHRQFELEKRQVNIDKHIDLLNVLGAKRMELIDQYYGIRLELFKELQEKQSEINSTLYKILFKDIDK